MPRKNRRNPRNLPAVSATQGKPLIRGSNLAIVDYQAHGVDLYRQNARELFARSSGIERYVIGIFGPELIGSWAMALDVNRQFYNTPNRVANLDMGPKIVRSRQVCTVKGVPRTEHWQRVSIQESYAVNPQGAGAFDYYYTGPFRTETSGTVNKPPQEPIYGTIRDTTRKTRPAFLDQGEFELFIPKLTSPNRDVAWKGTDSLVTNAIGNGQRVKTEVYYKSQITGPEVYVTNADVQVYLASCRLRALAAMQKYTDSMMARIHPNHRTYDLFYQIAELKDLRQTLQGSLQVWMSFERLVGTRVFESLLRSARNWRNPTVLRHYASTAGRHYGFQFDELRDLDQTASSAYLSFKFGWESMVRGIRDFLPSPAKITRDINFLVERIGRDNSFRTKKTWRENEPSVPTMRANLYRNEGIHDLTVRKQGVRHCELRVMANFAINFPNLDSPRFRQRLFDRKLGLYPTPLDLYNLIPWTWLADWFLGAGDYLKLLETISGDKNTVNYGFATYREDTVVSASMAGRLVTTTSRNINGVFSTYDTYQVRKHAGNFILRYQLRMSIPRISSVKSYWDSNLSATQTTIIGALLGTRSGFRPRRGV